MLLRRYAILFFCLIISLDLFGSSYRSSSSSSRSYSSSSSRSSSSSKSYSSSKSSKPSSKSYSSSSSSNSSSSSSSSKPKFSFFGKAEKAQAKADSASKYKARSQQSYEYLRSQPSETYKTREARQRNVFKNYYGQPSTNTSVQASGFNPFFWMWLLDNASHQAAWAYHHKDQLTDTQYKELLAKNKDLEAKIKEMEDKKIPKDPNYSPEGVDKDLMYSDEYAKSANKDSSGDVWLITFLIALTGIPLLLWIFRKRLF